MNKRFLDLPLSYKVVFATLVVLLLGAVMMLVLGARAVAPVATVEMQKNTAAVGRALSTQFALAVSAGIPIDRLNGVEDLLREVLEDNPTLRGMELVASDGRRLMQVGAALPARDTSGSDWQGGSVTSSPIQVGQQIVGIVRVGGDARFVEQEVIILLGAIVALFVAASVAMIELIRLICRRTIDEPVSRLQADFHQVLAGQLPQPEPLLGSGAFAQATHRFQQLLRHVQDRFDHIATSARAIRGLDLDAVSGARLSDLLEQVNRGLRPAAETKQVTSAAYPVWPLFFALILAELPRAILPVLMLDRVSGPWRDLFSILPLALWATGLLLGYYAGSRESMRPGRLFWAGCAGIASGFLLFLLVSGPVGLVLGRFLSGLGIGVIWQRFATPSARPSLGLAGLLIGADLVGPVLGNVLVESLGWPWVAVAGGLGAIALASWGYRSLDFAGHATGSRQPLPIGRWPSALAAGILSAGLLHLWLPQHLPEHGLIMSAYALVGFAILGGAYLPLPNWVGWGSAVIGAWMLVWETNASWPVIVALPLLGGGLGRFYRDGDDCPGAWVVGWSLGLMIGAALMIAIRAMAIPLNDTMLVVPAMIGLLALWSVRHRRHQG